MVDIYQILFNRKPIHVDPIDNNVPQSPVLDPMDEALFVRVNLINLGDAVLPAIVTDGSRTIEVMNGKFDIYNSTYITDTKRKEQMYIRIAKYDGNANREYVVHSLPTNGQYKDMQYIDALIVTGSAEIDPGQETPLFSRVLIPETFRGINIIERIATVDMELKPLVLSPLPGRLVMDGRYIVSNPRVISNWTNRYKDKVREN